MCCASAWRGSQDQHSSAGPSAYAAGARNACTHCCCHVQEVWFTRQESSAEVTSPAACTSRDLPGVDTGCVVLLQRAQSLQV
jgi:hypothetical protein